MVNKPNHPKVSIVTVTFNARAALEKTINSIINQKFTDYEYIIIDGNSQDNTSSIIDKYKSHIDVYVSEKDGGVYYAMNKSLNFITGDWVIFLNAGDTFASDDTLGDIFCKKYDEKYCAIFGDAYRDNRGKLSYIKANPFWNYSPFSYGSGICHQSIFINSIIMKRIKYDVKYRIASDFDMMVRLYSLSRNFLYVNLPICTYETSYGLSARNRLKALEECRLITNREKDTEYWKNYLLLSAKYVVRRILNV